MSVGLIIALVFAALLVVWAVFSWMRRRAETATEKSSFYESHTGSSGGGNSPGEQ